MPSASSVSSDRSFLRRLTSDTLKRAGIEAGDHPREQALDAVHARPFPAEVIADLKDVELAWPSDHPCSRPPRPRPLPDPTARRHADGDRPIAAPPRARRRPRR